MGATSLRLRTCLAIFLGLAIAYPLSGGPAQARGPEAVADVAEQVIDAIRLAPVGGEGRAAQAVFGYFRAGGAGGSRA